jgi:beta-glucanase (GH16 family)
LLLENLFMTFNANNPTASGMVLTFDDEFDRSSISSASGADGTNWTNHIWFHSPTPQDFQVSNGVMNVLGNNPNDPWAANMETVDSSGQGFSQKFGYFEADIKVSGGQGTWPAFWMFDANRVTNGNALGQEFDIMEGQGSVANGYFGTIHSDTNNAGGQQDQQNANNFINTGQNIADGFHRFGLLWDPNSPDMTFYFDGKPMSVVPKFADTDQNPMQMILGSGFGDIGLGTNNVNGNTPIPADVQVDYVRAYQFASQNPVAVQAEAVSTAAGNTDPTALANALGQMPGSSSGSGSSVAPPSGTGTGPDTLTVHVSGDQFQGDPQFTLAVDGQQIGGVQSVTAVHSSGQFQDITFNGTFANAKQAVITFTNDAFGGSASEDRNLYVASITVDGHQLLGDQGVDNANNGFVTTQNGFAPVEPHVAVMDVDGTLSFNIAGLAAATSPASGSTTPSTGSGTTTSTGSSSTTPAPAPAAGDTGTGPDTLTVHVSGDPFQGDPQFTLTVDGQQIGGVQSVSAVHSSGQYQDIAFHGNFANAATADISFLNDAWGGSASQDRNLYVGSITLDGHQITGSEAMSDSANNGFDTTANGYAPVEPNVAVMDVNGTTAFNISGLASAAASSSGGSTSGSGSSTPAAAEVGSGPDTLTVAVSGDQFQGDPQFTLTVDGQQIGGAQSITAVHSSGQFEQITFHGNFANAQNAVINFTNDAWGGAASEDRNLYVASMTLDGHQLLGSQGTDNASNGFVTPQNGYAPVEPNVAVMDVNGSLSFNVAGLGGAHGPTLQPSFVDIAGQDVFVFNTALQNGAQIANFDPTHDVLDLAPLLNADGYKGTDPVKDNVIAFVQSGTDSTAVMIDPTGHNPAQGTTVVTLDHVLPQSASTATLMH